MAPNLAALLWSVVAVIFVSRITNRILAQSTSSAWKTLSGSAPLIVAHGGLSGLFPDQTNVAYAAAINNSLSNAIMFCDLQLTKDGKGLCRTDLRLDFSTNIAEIYPNQNHTYRVNGVDIGGWFSIAFSAKELLENAIQARQTNPSRSPSFDYNYPVVAPHDLSQLQPAGIWLNVQYSKFFEEHNLSMSAYVLSASKEPALSYISSPEVEFLRGIAKGLRRSKTKLILSFPDKEKIDPSTNGTYDSLLNNMTFVKTFASGILVPKNYIWPTSTGLYLQPHTSLVQDAHTVGLEVFAADFANDASFSYNYSYDPIREYLQFVDNADFAVDGVLTDFPVTASEAVACYAHNRDRAASRPGKPLIIAYNGASGDYPACTDIAYQAAIKDGADYIGCSVQMTKDGIPICRESPDLLISTTVSSDSLFFPSRVTNVPEIQDNGGIFTFDLTWKEIQSLKPNISSPFAGNGTDLFRNPAYANVGKFMSLSDFLVFAKSQGSVGVLINVQYARYLAAAKNFNVTDVIISALNENGYNNMTERVKIQSDDSAVLFEFKQRTSFKLVYQIDETRVTVASSAIKQIKEFADTVTLSRNVVFPSTVTSFLLETTGIVSQLQRQNISVFIYRLRNEFVSLAFDYQADPTMEINTFVEVSKADGLMTDFPATAKAYLGNACLHHQNDDYSMFLVIPGAILPLTIQAPPLPPAPNLTTVLAPPLPSANVSTPSPGPASPPLNGAPGTNTAASIACHFTGSLLVSLLMGLLILIFNCN